MKVKNAMEQAVRAEIARQLEMLPAGPSLCRCSHCIADVLALSLTTLTPRYWTVDTHTESSATADTDAVREAVARAIHTVRNVPHHQPGMPGSDREHVRVVNHPLEESFMILDKVPLPVPTACDCWKCRCDTVAFALNRFPPLYGVVDRPGGSLPAEERATLRAELVPFLNVARRVVGELPRH